MDIFDKIKKNMNSKNKSFNVNNLFKNKTTNILKGFNKNTTRKQFMNSKPSFINQFKDSDGDGYINRIDCRPFDKTRQGNPEVKKTFYMGADGYYKNVKKIAGKEDIMLNEFFENRRPVHHMEVNSQDLNILKKNDIPFYSYDSRNIIYDDKTNKVTKLFPIQKVVIMYHPKAKKQAYEVYKLFKSIDDSMQYKKGDKYNDSKLLTKKYHIQVGKALGYHDDEIRKFVSNY